ncbi:hypothetical protein Talka_00353 [Tepidimonas alkaliphilus]|uniref:DUF541 domain-containing protein n=1 Tax=Tepidimonas alkaliphilus TaxID=2588942 RepID=A0A554WDL9_9BURK|nr:SIMPL domain-containing protein [Tepidimonas alkaliphilus]TSE21675.1 hypothetical protein Talka_00353 [Tepidimonas alkaliphilus]
MMRSQILRALSAARRLMAAVGLAALSCTAAATTPNPVVEPAARVVHLQAQAERRLPHDWAVVTLVAHQQGSEAAAVQAQLRQTVQLALTSLRAHQQPGDFEVSSGSFVVQPRYGREGQIVGWLGSAELRVQGRDLARVAALTQGLPGLAVGAVRLELARETRREAESALRQQAIEAFRQQADEVARAFGARGWVLREAHVSLARPAGAGEPVGLRTLALPASAESGAALPLEPGLEWLQVTVSGSITLQP